MNKQDAATDTPASAVADPFSEVAVCSPPSGWCAMADWNAERRCYITRDPMYAHPAPPLIARSAADAAALIKGLREFKTRDWHRIQDDDLADLLIAFIETASAAPVGSQQSGSGEATVVDTALTRSDLIGIAKFALIEMEKISKIFDDAIAKCEAQNSPPASGVGEQRCSYVRSDGKQCVYVAGHLAHHIYDDQINTASSDTQARSVSGAIRKALCKCGALVEEKDVDEHCAGHG